MKRRDKFGSYCRGKETNVVTDGIQKGREIKDDSEASIRGIVWMIVPLTKSQCLKRGCILE